MRSEPLIKYRLTGASVLIAVAVIFLPLILDGQKKNQILESKIPEKPISGEIVLVNIAKSDIAQINAQGKNAKQQSGSDTSNANHSVIKSTNAIKESTVLEKDAKKQSAAASILVDTTAKITNKTGDKRLDRPDFQSSAFVIQLGSFSNHKNALKLVEKLKGAGYKAYLKVVTSNGKTVSRVLVGPQLKRQQSQSKIKPLNKLSGLQSIILVYDPLRH